MGNSYVQGLMAQVLPRKENALHPRILQRVETETAPRTLRFGSSGDDVRELQSDLNARSDVSTALEVDGIFGPVTTRAVRELQTANPPLAVDGIVGPLTRAVIESGPGSTDNKLLAKKVFYRGAAAYDRGDYAHAYDFFVRAGELQPHPALVFSRAQALRRLGGRREEAIALYEEYLASGHGKRDADATRHLVELRGPAQTGVKEVDKEAARALFLKGAKLYDAGDYAHAYDEFTKAGELQPHPALVFSRAQALRRLGGRREEAIALFEEYLASGHGKRDADATRHLAELRGPAPTGVEEVDKEVARALFLKGAKLYDAGDYAHAYDEFTKAGELKPHPALVFSRAQALRRLGGRRDEAIALYEEYLASGHGKRDGDAAFHLGELKSQGAEP